MIDTIASAENSAVFHMRGGDFKLDSRLAMEPDFIKYAGSKYDNLYLVTNNIAWAKLVLRGMQVKAVEGFGVVEDFIIMLKCKNKILSNSTFAWWAAELGDD